MTSSVTAQRTVAWLALACHVLVSSGLPLPPAPRGVGRAAAARLAAKDRSRPFPCMDKPCGCATAEQCFTSCCCRTPAQRLAWARAHQVAPAVLAALEHRVARRSAASAGCCTSQRRAAPARAAVETPADGLDGPDVCRDYRSLAADPALPEVPADDTGTEAPVPGSVILRDMLACGGVVSAWLACGVALPPPPRVAAPGPDASAGSLVLRDVVAASICADRVPPPPRVA